MANYIKLVIVLTLMYLIGICEARNRNHTRLADRIRDQLLIRERFHKKICAKDGKTVSKSFFFKTPTSMIFNYYLQCLLSIKCCNYCTVDGICAKSNEE